jgi:hypothetical protein
MPFQVRLAQDSMKQTSVNKYLQIISFIFILFRIKKNIFPTQITKIGAKKVFLQLLIFSRALSVKPSLAQLMIQFVDVLRFFHALSIKVFFTHKYWYCLYVYSQPFLTWWAFSILNIMSWIRQYFLVMSGNLLQVLKLQHVLVAVNLWLGTFQLLVVFILLNARPEGFTHYSWLHVIQMLFNHMRTFLSDFYTRC